MSIRPFDSDEEPRSPMTDSLPSLPARTPGIQIQGYEIVREVARAGQGIVYQAIQKSTNQEVALKTLRSDGSLPDTSKRELEKAFKLEIELIAQLKHPNIISIHDAGTTADGRPFYAMEYVNGKPLGEYVDEHKLAMMDTLRLFRTVCEAVGFAHQRGVIHFDLKPSNILVDTQGIVKVLDFGIARPLLVPGQPPVAGSGKLIGTLAYMSPEQACGNRPGMDAHTDVYSLGVILYKLLTGSFPYPVPPESTLTETIEHIRKTPPAALRKKWTTDLGVAARSDARGRVGRCPIDKDISAVVLAALAKEPERRYRDAGEFARAVERYTTDLPIDPDKMWDVLRHRGRRAVERHRFAVMGGVVVIVSLLCNLFLLPLLFNFPKASDFFFKMENALLPAAVKEFDYDHVRVIAIKDDTPLEKLARSAGLNDVTLEQPRSLRRLFGRLMENLAVSRCSSVVWDIGLVVKSDFDKDFIAGVRRLKDAGIGVVMTVDQWWLDENDRPALVAEIASEVQIGCSIASLGGNFPWFVMLVAQRGMADPLPSLSLAGFAASRYPGSHVDYRFDSTSASLNLLYWSSPEGGISNVKNYKGMDHIKLTDTRDRRDVTPLSVPAYSGRSDLLDTDSVGLFYVAVPSDQKLAAATIPYETAFRAGKKELEDRFAGKVVIIADQRSGIDWSAHPDGRTLPRCYAHASAIESLARKTFVQSLKRREEKASAWIGAFLGCSVAVTMSGSALRRYAALVGLAVVFLGMTLLACFVLYCPHLAHSEVSGAIRRI